MITLVLALAALPTFGPGALADDAALPSTSETAPSPHPHVRPVAPGETRWTSGFWFDRFENLRTNMLPNMGRLMEGTNYSQYLENFRIAAGLAKGRARGAPFNDGDFYKWMEAASWVLAIRPDPALDHRLDTVIAVISEAQRDDGYLHTPVLIRARQGDPDAVPFQSRHNFEMYNMGHLFTAASAHYRATGKTNLLVVARKAADFLDATFRDASPEAARSSVCPSHYMGIVDLWRVTRESRYLNLAKKFFLLRSQVTGGGDDNQDRIPFEQQTHAMGHAVRANYLYAGAADLFMETGDASLWKPLAPIWTNVVFRKMHLTGGCGALYDGASPDGSRDQSSISRVHQAYGRNYQLPNATAHNETCANIGNVLWNWRMFLATGEARYLDVAERALYNSVLSGVSLDGTNFFYTNPLRVTDPMPANLRWSRVRVPFVSAFCCPPNVLRLIASSSGYAYAKSSDAIWVNLYGGSELATKLKGRAVRLRQETEYPWNGRVRITVQIGTEDPTAPNGGMTFQFALQLRLPHWAKRAVARVNQSRVFTDGEHGSRPSGEYLELRRTWRSGDVVDLDLDMPARLIEAHPLVEETLNQVAVQRGPVVYCLESIDLPPGVRLTDVAIPADVHFVARYDRRLLGGVAALDGVLLAKPGRKWSARLYREFHAPQFKSFRAQLIPYSAWANRGPSEMTVWLPLARP